VNPNRLKNFVFLWLVHIRGMILPFKWHSKLDVVDTSMMKGVKLHKIEITPITNRYAVRRLNFVNYS